MKKRWINFGPTSFPEIDIKEVERKKNCKFVCELPIRGSGGWTNFPAQIYYQEEPPVEGYSNYFALYYDYAGLHITSGQCVVGIAIPAVVTAEGEVIYSRCRHDFRRADTADMFVDGGLDYFRVGGSDLGADGVYLTIKGAELVVVDDPDELRLLLSRSFEYGVTAVIGIKMADQEARGHAVGASQPSGREGLESAIRKAIKSVTGDLDIKSGGLSLVDELLTDLPRHQTLIDTLARDNVLTEAAKACDALARSYDNEHNRAAGTVESMSRIAEDCAELIRDMRSNGVPQIGG
jgi:hypothetical protein